jgi:hypothetical protein
MGKLLILTCGQIALGEFARTCLCFLIALSKSIDFYQFLAEISLEVTQSVYSLSIALRGTRLRSWLRHCATNRKVTGSIPVEVSGFFQLS